ncbi:MAG: hypothetical protein K9G36_08920 [Crocinitomicaceae bacterium]|nr:hypothetical protein [Crocinitomicaceae bacterium]MCF8411603.1 hypothetical protein [Crocinitomicaceae bacterium]MCF8444208.1 hypothetical protein [Crocinitomicaceae bacterium]
MIVDLIDFNVNFNFTFSFWAITSFSLIGLLIYFAKNIDKFELLIGGIGKFLKFVSKKFDYTYVKYNLQGKINEYLSKISKKVKHIDIKKINIKWIDPETQDEKQFIQNGELIIRLKKGENQNENLVKASMAFISMAFLKKAKSYVAKYQRESLDLFACYDLLKEEKAEILDQFVQDFMKEKLDDNKIADFFEKYSDIDDAGIFYPVLVQELTFLGEKVFASKRDAQKIYEEVRNLVNFLYRYANRKLREDNISDFTGHYCKFGIRIIGRSTIINTRGDKVYIRHLKKISDSNETLYLIGNKEHKKFMKSIFEKCKDELGYELLSEETYKATIKDPDGSDLEVKNYMMTVRNNNIKVYHKK